ncbi:MAG: hypothetical protein MUF54_06815, partial [Polyangiaceae bacterium]|nr:hypothetical protein [Polyangiaceae bacterium]
MANGSRDRLHTPDGATRYGGVRADFVANLGRHLVELRRHFDVLVRAPNAPRLRDELSRRVHALGTRARVLHFEAMADKLDAAERRLERSAEAGGLDAEDVTHFEALFRDLPCLAWNQSGRPPGDGAAPTSASPATTPAGTETRSVTASSSSHASARVRASVDLREPALSPAAVVVFGEERLVNLLVAGRTEQDPPFECEQSRVLDSALELAQAVAP